VRLESLAATQFKNLESKERTMKTISWLVLGLLLLGPTLQTVNARPQNDKRMSSIEQVKIQVAKLGIGDKARATITTKDSAKVKGYVYSAGDDDFVMRDRKTDAPTTIRYADVVKIERNKGHSMARNIMIGVGIGAGALLAAIFIAIARAD
jgi:phage repressor protein C with HTH and peptisase S24 domain